MLPLQQAIPGAVCDLLRAQPLSEGKVKFAWRTAAGPVFARVSDVYLADDGVLHVRVEDQRWQRELKRSTRVVLARLQRLLGEDIVTRIAVT